MQAPSQPDQAACRGHIHAPQRLDGYGRCIRRPSLDPPLLQPTVGCRLRAPGISDTTSRVWLRASLTQLDPRDLVGKFVATFSLLTREVPPFSQYLVARVRDAQCILSSITMDHSGVVIDLTVILTRIPFPLFPS